MEWLKRFTVASAKFLAMSLACLLWSIGLGAVGYFGGMWLVGLALPAQPSPEGLQLQFVVAVFLSGALWATGAISPFVAAQTVDDRR
jgi:hypothetical protein